MFVNWDNTLPYLQVLSSTVDPLSYQTLEQYQLALSCATAFDFFFSIAVFFGLVSMLLGWIFRVVSRS